MAGFYHGELSPCALHHLLYALAQGKPIVAEYLDFTKKKQDVSESSSKAARALSSFADNKILMTMRAQCFRLGINMQHYLSIKRRPWLLRVAYSTLQNDCLIVGVIFLTIKEVMSLCLGL
ncbi:hypothetical protein EBS02_10395 [bacterium]|nr:hypothetical protein [bacterium]